MKVSIFWVFDPTLLRCFIQCLVSSTFHKMQTFIVIFFLSQLFIKKKKEKSTQNTSKLDRGQKNISDFFKKRGYSKTTSLKKLDQGPKYFCYPFSKIPKRGKYSKKTEISRFCISPKSV